MRFFVWCRPSFICMNLLYHLDNKSISSSHEESSPSNSLSDSTTSWNSLYSSFHYSSIFLWTFPFSSSYIFSCLARFMSSCSYSSNLPNKVVKSKVLRFCGSLVAVSSICHSLVKHLNFLLIFSTLDKSLPSPINLFTIWENLFYRSATVSPCFIRKRSYFWVSVFIFDYFLSLVPSSAICNTL